jgi:hypothetical protein
VSLGLFNPEGITVNKFKFKIQIQGPTVIGGFLGVSPGTAVTGAPGYPTPCLTATPSPTCGLAQDKAAAAMADVTIAYDKAAARGIDTAGVSNATIIPKVGGGTSCDSAPPNTILNVVV